MHRCAGAAVGHTHEDQTSGRRRAWLVSAKTCASMRCPSSEEVLSDEQIDTTKSRSVEAGRQSQFAGRVALQTKQANHFSPDHPGNLCVMAPNRAKLAANSVLNCNPTTSNNGSSLQKTFYSMHGCWLLRRRLWQAYLCGSSPDWR